MTLEEFYAVVGGNYADASKRLMNDTLITRFLTKFRDSDMLTPINDAFAAQDWETLFRESHTMKGVALNLALTKLGASGSALCDSVRHGAPTTDITPLVEEVRADYAATMDALNQVL